MINLLHSPNLDNARAVATYDPTTERRVDGGQRSDNVLVILEEVLLAVRNQRNALGRAIRGCACWRTRPCFHERSNTAIGRSRSEENI